MCENTDGTLIFGNNDGALVYDGEHWKKVFLPNNSSIRSIVKTKEKIIGLINDKLISSNPPPEDNNQSIIIIPKNRDKEAYIICSSDLNLYLYNLITLNITSKYKKYLIIYYSVEKID